MIQQYIIKSHYNMIPLGNKKNKENRGNDLQVRYYTCYMMAQVLLRLGVNKGDRCIIRS
jgi:hypothetical protein